MGKFLKTQLWGTVPYLWLSLFNRRSPKIACYKYIVEHGYSSFPYAFAAKYLNRSVELGTDENNGLRYVVHKDGKKLYFPRFMTPDKIIKLYTSLMIEQDPESAHRYVDSLTEFDRKILLDVGSAEGVVSLDAIERVEFVYLFEREDYWVEALQATFAPWAEKVCIVRNFVSDRDDSECVTLDTFFKDKPKENLFLKMDVEGGERSVLEGAKNLFSTAKNLDFAICVYHRKDDMKVISAFLDRFDCTYVLRNGCMKFKHTYRPGLVRGYVNHPG